MYDTMQEARKDHDHSLITGKYRLSIGAQAPHQRTDPSLLTYQEPWDNLNFGP